MGRGLRGKLILLLLCLGLTAVPVLRHSAAAVKGKTQHLETVLASIPGWEVIRRIPLDPQVVEDLKLDDYAFLSLSNGRDVVSLYVGYYFSADKVGAPHHPLVCFSGQGWQLSPVTGDQLNLAGGESLSFATMTASRDLEDVYLAYWFQAHDETAASPFMQKLRLARDRLLNGFEDSAFVRVSLPVGEKTPAQCRRLVEDFLQAFYPVFLTYVRKDA